MFGFFMNSTIIQVVLSYMLHFPFFEIFCPTPSMDAPHTYLHSTTENNTKLLLVQMVFRHGDRAPIYLYPTDPNTIDCWPEGLGRLTLTGKRQQYALGKALRSIYKDFVTSNPNEVLVNSSAADRCLTSAATTIASFCAPEGRWKLEDDLNWQPIPIYYFPTTQDKFLSYQYICPRLKYELIQLMNSPEIVELYQRHQAMIEAVSNYSGLNISDGFQGFYLHDTLFVERTHNLTIPEWVDAYWKELEEIEKVLYRTVTSSFLTLRLRIGPLLNDILDNMEKKINGTIPNLKVQVYSTHDVVLIGLINAMNFTNFPQPPYCATLLFELHEMADATMAVRLLYLNSTDPLADMGEPQVLVLEDCSEFCPVENFTKKFQHLIPVDCDCECKLNATKENCDKLHVIENEFIEGLVQDDQS